MYGFIEYLKETKHKSENTLLAYDRDIKAFETFMKDSRRKTATMCAENDAIAYVFELGNANKSKATINRKISALRTYFDYLIHKGEIIRNPFDNIKSTKADARQIDYLTIEEVNRLLELPDESEKGLRDRALLEFMYGTGARVTELVRLRMSDLNLKMGFVALKDANEESRVVPLGSYAKDALARYINMRIGDREDYEDEFVFTNLRGETLTRQGIWKILKSYGAQAELEDRMTPQLLRDSFAIHILMNGGDLKSLQELMGFDDMSVGIAYLSVIDIHVRDVFKRCHPRA